LVSRVLLIGVPNNETDRSRYKLTGKLEAKMRFIYIWRQVYIRLGCFATWVIVDLFHSMTSLLKFSYEKLNVTPSKNNEMLVVV